MPRNLGSKSVENIPRDGEDEGVDLHSGEFCVDVSTFGDIVFENQGREACDTTFEKECETKTEQVSPKNHSLIAQLRFRSTTLARSEVLHL